LLAGDPVVDEHYWAVIRKYMPATGCRVDEVIWIAKTSRFSAPISGRQAFYTIVFENPDRAVLFRLEKAAGNIDNPAVLSAGLPSF
jgi:hypothetical protein